MSHRRIGVGPSVLCCGIIILAGACASESPTGADPMALEVPVPAFAKPASCEQTIDVDLQITLGEGVGGTQAIRGDDAANTPYQEGVDGVGAHLSDINGNLMLSLLDSPARRYAWTSSAGSGLSNDRLYTNSHSNPGGSNACGLAGMVNGSTGSAVLEAELQAGATSAAIIRYGKTCSGGADAATRVATTRSADGLSWTITGTAGVHCDKNNRNKLVQVGTAGPFSMTLLKTN